MVPGLPLSGGAIHYGLVQVLRDARLACPVGAVCVSVSVQVPLDAIKAGMVYFVYLGRGDYAPVFPNRDKSHSTHRAFYHFGSVYGLSIVVARTVAFAVVFEPGGEWFVATVMLLQIQGISPAMGTKATPITMPRKKQASANHTIGQALFSATAFTIQAFGFSFAAFIPLHTPMLLSLRIVPSLANL